MKVYVFQNKYKKIIQVEICNFSTGNYGEILWSARFFDKKYRYDLSSFNDTLDGCGILLFNKPNENQIKKLKKFFGNESICF